MLIPFKLCFTIPILNLWNKQQILNIDDKYQPQNKNEMNKGDVEFILFLYTYPQNEMHKVAKKDTCSQLVS